MTELRELSITDNIIYKVFDDAIDSRSIGNNFFQNIRLALKSNLMDHFSLSGLQFSTNQDIKSMNIRSSKQVTTEPIKTNSTTRYIPEELDLEFCHKYGTDYYSVRSMNYHNQGGHCLPALNTLLSIKDFSIGNIVFVVNKGSYGIAISYEKPLKLVGYTYDISPSKRKPYFCLLGIHFDHDYLINTHTTRINQCLCDPSVLDEIQIQQVHFPVFFICRQCGRLYTCRCFENHFDQQQDIKNKVGPVKDSLLETTINAIGVKENICYLCNKTRFPSLSYGHPMYYSLFMQKHLPYYELYRRKYPHKDNIENALREDLDYPRIGEKWASETILFNTVKSLLPEKEVVFHYRGKELQGLELDIWIPEHKLGIEYQGIQHYEPIKHWGGSAGLEKRKRNDLFKKNLCKSLGYALVEIKYDDQLDTESIFRKIAPFLRT